MNRSCACAEAEDKLEQEKEKLDTLQNQEKLLKKMQAKLATATTEIKGMPGMLQVLL